jgi:hypothetical protein
MIDYDYYRTLMKNPPPASALNKPPVYKKPSAGPAPSSDKKRKDKSPTPPDVSKPLRKKSSILKLGESSSNPNRARFASPGSIENEVPTTAYKKPPAIQTSLPLLTSSSPSSGNSPLIKTIESPTPETLLSGKHTIQDKGKSKEKEHHPKSSTSPSPAAATAAASATSSKPKSTAKAKAKVPEHKSKASASPPPITTPATSSSTSSKANGKGKEKEHHRSPSTSPTPAAAPATPSKAKSTSSKARATSKGHEPNPEPHLKKRGTGL